MPGTVNSCFKLAEAADTEVTPGVRVKGMFAFFRNFICSFTADQTDRSPECSLAISWPSL